MNRHAGKNKKVLRFPQNLGKPLGNNTFDNPALAGERRPQDGPLLDALGSLVKLVKPIGKTTFPGGRSGPAQSHKKPYLAILGKSYGFRKTLENHWGNNVSGNLLCAKTYGFLSAMTLATEKMTLRQRYSSSISRLPGLIRHHCGRGACTANPGTNAGTRLSKIRKVMIPL